MISQSLARKRDLVAAPKPNAMKREAWRGQPENLLNPMVAGELNKSVLIPTGVFSVGNHIGGDLKIIEG